MAGHPHWGIGVRPERPLRLSVKASAQPAPHLLRAAIGARLEGRAFPGRTEDEVAASIVAALRARTGDGEAAKWL